MILGFGNNVISSLAAEISSTQTTLTVFPGTGEQFAALLTYEYTNKSNSPKVYGKITLTDAGETSFEICHLLSVSGDTLTVVRGQEGTTAKGWNLNDVVANFATKGSENSFVQAELIQNGQFTSGVAGGSANALTLELPTTYFVNGSTDWTLRAPLIVYPTQNNTGASTLQLTMGGKVLGIFPLYKGNKAQLVANDILKDVALVCLLDNSKTFFNVANPGAIYAGLGTAAFKDVVTSMTDTTAGRIPTVGWMGLGSIAPRTAPVSAFNYDNIPTGLPSGFWTHTLTGGPYAYTFTLYQDGGGSLQSRHFIIPATPTGRIAFRWDGATGASTLDYQFFYTDKNPPTAANVGALPITGGSLTGQLVSAYPAVTGVAQIQARTIDGNGAGDGFTHIGYNTGTTASPSYSHYFRGKGSTNINTTGGLNVTFSASVGGNITASGTITPGSYSNFDARYYTKAQSDAAYMSKTGAYTKAESDTRYYTRAQSDAAYMSKTGAYTKAESDARYVQDIDHTAAVEKQFFDGQPYSNTHTTDGAYLANIRFVGGMSNSGWFIIRYTRKKINGVWYTLS